MNGTLKPYTHYGRRQAGAGASHTPHVLAKRSSHGYVGLSARQQSLCSLPYRHAHRTLAGLQNTQCVRKSLTKPPVADSCSCSVREALSTLFILLVSEALPIDYTQRANLGCLCEKAGI